MNATQPALVKEVLLDCKLFPRRVIAFLPPDTGTLKDQTIHCHICNARQIVDRTNQKMTTRCKHLVRCNECSDYQIEKIYRCAACCSELLGSLPPPCNQNCQRLQNTQGAVCNICKGNLVKDCTICKSTLTFRQTRRVIRNIISVFVVHPQHLPEPFTRPCSHYSPCKYCTTKLCKARKKSAICSSCRKFHSERRKNLLKETQEDTCISASYNVPSTLITSVRLDSLIHKRPFLLLENDAFLSDSGGISSAQSPNDIDNNGSNSNIIRAWRL